MGSGGFGTNASMHWKVSHLDQDPQATSAGRDPISTDQIGRGSNGSKNHPGRLKVRLRFKGPTASTGGVTGVNDWIDDLQAQLAGYDRNLPSQDFVLTIQVPAIFRNDPAQDQPWEVIVDW
jgi:hypothetical protein